MSELVASVSLEFVSGDDITLEFTVTRDDEPVDITGMTARFAVARRVGSAPVLSTEDGTAEAVVTDGANGVFRVTATGSATEGLFGTYRFEVKLDDVSGDRATVARGFMSFRESLL